MRLQLVLCGVVGLGLVSGLGAWQLSRVGIHQGYAPEQPIAFPHKVHAGDNKIPCLYCHYAARTSRHAGIPPASLCMNCHTMLEKQTVAIEKLKEAVQQQRPIVWVKVHNLPDYVYFDHSAHISAGLVCASCHGRVDQMTRVTQKAPLSMSWCLDCHRDASGASRPVVAANGRAVRPPTHCSGCHR